MKSKLQQGSLVYLILDNHPGISIVVNYTHSESGVDYYEIPKPTSEDTAISFTCGGQVIARFHHVKISGSREVYAYDPTGAHPAMRLGKGGVH